MKTPINDGILQSDLDTNGFDILGLDTGGGTLPDMTANSRLLGSSTIGAGLPPSEITLGSNLSMSGSTLNATGGGGGTSTDGPAPWTIRSAGNYTDPGTYPFTPENSGLFIKDATGREILRLWSGNSDTSTVGYNNFNLYLGYEAGFTQPSDNTTAGTQNVGIGPWALRYITTGQGNTAVGANALRYNQGGLANVAIGASAMQSSHRLEGSTAVGVNALKDADDGGQGGDTAIGFAALYQQGTAGGDNTSVGRYSGLGVLKDNGMVFLGSGARRIGDSNIPMINAISIGYQAEVATSYTTVIGNVQHTDVYFGSTAGNAVLHGNGIYIGSDARLVPISGGAKLEVRNTGTGVWVEAARWTNP